MSDVVPIRPKTMNRKYRGQSYRITFLKETKTWRWDVTFTQVTEYGDEAATMNKAQKAAEKHIDKLLGMKRK